jgi:hypothetical protein
VRIELDIAADLKKPIVPMVIEQADIPDTMRHPLAGKQWLDLSVNPASGYASVRAAVRVHGSRAQPVTTSRATEIPSTLASTINQLSAIVPGKWNVEIIDRSSSPFTTETTELYVFSFEMFSTFTAALVREAHLKYLPFDGVKGEWSTSDDTSVVLKREVADAGSYRKPGTVSRWRPTSVVSYRFLFDVIRANELRGTTDFSDSRDPASPRRGLDLGAGVRNGVAPRIGADAITFSTASLGSIRARGVKVPRWRRCR